MKNLMLCFIFLIMGASTAISQPATTNPLRWYKGNTHTHTTLSDGDSTPGLVSRWYRNNGYDFLVLTDHNLRAEVDELQISLNADSPTSRPFLLIHGEEVSESFGTKGNKIALHTCGIDTQTTVGKKGGATKLEVLQTSIDGIRAAGGLPSVNHPNFQWSLTADDLTEIQHLHHFEIYNGHPHVNNEGGGEWLGAEQIWDVLLTRDKLYYGVAVDDAHHFKRFDRNASNPGKGWVVVRAAELTPKAITAGLAAGNFYSSTGVMLDEVSTASKTLAVKIAQERDCKYRTEFIGKDGKVLATDTTMTPAYKLRPGDQYARARITDSSGAKAWTQPVFEND